MSDEVLSERDFEQAADQTLRALEQALDALSERSETAGRFESDLESGILTIEFEDRTRYVINSHRAARQIWMAAERSAWHFDLVKGHVTPRWVASKSQDELWSAVGGVLSRKLGTAIGLTVGGTVA